MAKKDIDFSREIKENFKPISCKEQCFIKDFINFLNYKVEAFNKQAISNKICLTQVKEVYKRGVHDAIKLEKPIGLWAMARVNMFLKMANGSKVSDSYKKLDRDIIKDFSFFIDDGIRDDIIFSFEQISEARFEIESFNLSDLNDYSFVDLEEYAELNFPNSAEGK